MKYFAILLFVVSLLRPSSAIADDPSPKDVLTGLQSFYAKTARPDGSFRPGIPEDYPGMSDSAYSDMAWTVYPVVLHRTF